MEDTILSLCVSVIPTDCFDDVDGSECFVVVVVVFLIRKQTQMWIFVKLCSKRNQTHTYHRTPLYGCLLAYLPMYLGYLPTNLPTYLPTCLPTCLRACLPACLPAWLPVCLPTCLPA